MTSQQTLSDTPGAVAARARRIRRGVETEAAAKAQARERLGRPSLQNLLQMPLLEAIQDAGGRARPRDLYARIAEELGIDVEARKETRTCADQTYNLFEQQVRWARQTAVAQGLIAKGERGIWELADAGQEKLRRVRRGAVVLLYSLDDGLALWAHAEEAASAIEPGSLDLIMTSPPYPVVNRAYGRFTVPDWLAWMSDLVGMWKELLTDRGTLCVNLMDVFQPGTPCLSPYVERFTIDAIDRHGLHLAGRMPWHSPTKLANIEWAVKRRVRLRNSVEHVILFSKDPNPNWDTRRLPREEYADRSEARLAAGRRRASTVRPSGYDLNEAAFERNDNGRIPGNLLVAGGASGASTFAKRCREAGVPIHPARFPEALPRRVIQLTTDVGQTVYDPMAGSNTTGKVALELGRRFISSEPMLAYAEASAMHFDSRPDFRLHGSGG
ncbi:site-specific DNA-methyltransferase [Methylorubrum extorquens]|uniref:Methyltransferase n=1 Tax=Methylorubrum extorquens DSM 13060 TaxID=882800 RepID=H1KCJ9_METEX|nr:site-specific DNA-methyltransferase [Methylorubrum extorquens]EHP94823.1 DNA methylase N-4/N-6 domain protein [Methylorubrum extorquens DSM 13060]